MMLGAERQAEMGMSRAIGLKRAHLTQMFIFEGTAYTLIATTLGMIFGIGVGALLVRILGLVFADSLAGFTLHYTITLPSLILTFLLVTISAQRLSRLNIVTAMRNLEASPTVDQGLRRLFWRPFRLWFTSFKFLLRGHPFVILYRNTIGTFLAIWRLTWALVRRGPLTLLLALALISFGVAFKDLQFYECGVSLMFIALGLLVCWFSLMLGYNQKVGDRLGFTIIGLSVLLYWVAPFGPFEHLLGLATLLSLDTYDSGPAIYVFASIFEISGSILLLIYNGDLVAKAVVFMTNRLTSLAPVARPSMAYPLNFKLRTGLTIAMFATVTYVIIFTSVMSDIYAQSYKQADRLSGGWQLEATTLNLSPQQSKFSEFVAEIKANPSLNAEISQIGTEKTTKVTMVPYAQDGQANSPVLFPENLRALDDIYLRTTSFPVLPRAEGYNSDREVWEALRTQPDVAVLNSTAPSNFYAVTGLDGLNKTFVPLKVEVQDGQGHSRQLKIIGFTPRSLWRGLYVSTPTAVQFLGMAKFSSLASTYYVKTRPGVNNDTFRLELGSIFNKYGLEPVVLAEIIQKENGATILLINLLTAYLALGLIIGIAGLGVISSRAVVERRQQIGMLRAIGFSRWLVQKAFLLESSYIALLGLFLGAALAVWNSAQYFATYNDDVSLSYHLPILTIALLLLGSYLATLLTTYAPSRAASRILPAEALRYE